MGALALACGGKDAVAPVAVTRHFGLLIHTGQINKQVASDSTGPTRVDCGVTFDLTASGDTSIALNQVTFRFYAGSQRVAPVFVDTSGASQLGGVYGVLIPGVTRSARVSVSYSSPFAVVLVHEFGGGAVKRDSVLVEVGCGTSVATPPPSPVAYDTARVLNAAATVQLGDSLRVRYGLTTAAGGWRTDVQLSGPCAVNRGVSDELQTTSRITVAIALPPTCATNVPITVTLTSVDASSHSVSQTIRSAITVADTIVPRLSGAVLNIESGPSRRPTLVQGDTVFLEISASDNGLLRRVSWAVQPVGIADSISPVGSTLSTVQPIVLPAAYTGAVDLRAQATDGAGNLSAMYSVATVVTPVTNAAITTTVQSLAVYRPLLDERHGTLLFIGTSYPSGVQRLYFANPLTFVSTDSVRLSVHDDLLALELTPGGDSAVVLAQSGNLYIVDIRHGLGAVTTVPMGAGVPSGGLVQLAVGANNHAWVKRLGFAQTPTGLYEVDLTTGALVPCVLPASVDSNALGFVLASRDKQRVFFGNFSAGLTRVDVGTGASVSWSTPALGIAPPLINPDGTELLLGMRPYDAASGAPVGAPLPPFPFGDATYAADGTSVLFTFANGVIGRMRTSDGVMIEYLRTGFRAPTISVSTSAAHAVLVAGQKVGIIGLP